MILRNCELWYPKLDPKRPNTKFSKAEPVWNVQIRTTSKEQKKEWEAASLKVKAEVPDEGPAYFYVNLRRKAVKANGENAEAPQVINGAKEAVDPTTIGNGSIGHIRLFQYEPPANEQGVRLASVLMAIQLTTHIVYAPKKSDEEDFDEEETKVIIPEGEGGDPDDFQKEVVQTKVVQKETNFQKPISTKKPSTPNLKTPTPSKDDAPFDDPIPDMGSKVSDKDAEDDVF